MSTAKIIGFYGAARSGNAVRLMWIERGAIKRETWLDVTRKNDRAMASLLSELNCSGQILPPSEHGYATV